MTFPLILRDRSSGWLFGVCAGLQRATGINAGIFRVSFLVGTYLYTVSTLLLFALLVVIMRSRRVSAAATPPGAAEQDPTALLTADAALREEMRTLNSRLAAFEAEALSRHSQTARRFREAGL